MLKILNFFLSGFGTGLLLVVPIGPANILCIKNTLKFGSVAGFMAGFGATLGDFLFILATLVGLLAISDIQSEYLNTMKYVCAGLLISFAIYNLIKIYMQSYDKNNDNIIKIDIINHNKKRNISILSGFLSSFILTVTNPCTPIGVISAVTAVGLGSGVLADNSLSAKNFFAAGILIGSLSWWFLLTIISRQYLKNLTQNLLSIMNYATYFLMLIMALYILL